MKSICVVIAIVMICACFATSQDRVITSDNNIGVVVVESFRNRKPELVIIAITPDMPDIQPEPLAAHENMLCMAEITEFDKVPCHEAVTLPIPIGLKD